MAAAYRYLFAPGVPPDEVAATLRLAVLAAESLHGAARVRLDAAHAADGRTCVIAAGTAAARDLNALFAGFVAREFGPAAFAVDRAAGPAPATA